MLEKILETKKSLFKFSKNTTKEAKSFFNYFSQEINNNNQWKKDAIITTTAQVGVMNWLQMIPPLIANINETTLETNWYVMTGFSILISYPYAKFRDFRNQKKKEKNLEKEIKNYFSNLNKPNHKKKKININNKNPLKKFIYEGTPFGIWHVSESLFRFGIMYGVKNLNKLIGNSIMYGGMGFFLGNIYGLVIDGSRYISGITKKKTYKEDYELNSNKFQLINKKIYEVETNKTKIKYLHPKNKNQIKKDVILIAASIGLLIASYKVIEPKYDILKKEKKNKIEELRTDNKNNQTIQYKNTRNEIVKIK